MRKPADISDDYEGAFEAFLELPSTKRRDPELLGECFRILLQQAGVKLPTLKKLTDFLTVNKQCTALLRRVNICFLLSYLKPVRHQFQFVLNEIKVANILDGFTIRGQVKLKPQRFELKYLLERMRNGRVFDEIPEQLDRPKYPSSEAAIRARDYHLLYRDKDLMLEVTRIKGDFLVLRYEVYFKNEIPLYPNLEKQLFALWRRATIGDFR